MAAGDRANQFIEKAAPWSLAKDPAQGRRTPGRLHDRAESLFRQLAIYLAPVLPRLAQQPASCLNQPIQRWEQSKQPLVGKPVSKYQHMMVRVRREQVDAMIEESKEKTATQQTLPQPATAVTATNRSQAEPLVENPITIDDFQKIDLRDRASRRGRGRARRPRSSSSSP